MADGNFHGDHVKMKYPENDVALAPNGEGYMVEDTQYKTHLSECKEPKRASTTL